MLKNRNSIVGKENSDMGEKQVRKNKRHFANYIVFLSIIAITVFTIAAFVLQFKGYMEISTTLTACWFAFWTVEIVALASIRNQKTKYEKKEEMNNGND